MTNPDTAGRPSRQRVPALSRLPRIVAAGAAAGLVLAGCSTASASDTAADAGAGGSTASATAVQAAAGTVLDASEVHSISLDVDETALAAMIQTYLDSGDKEWISATLTVDGTTYENVGVKLKGNSSLRGIGTDTPAQDLPWRIRTDEYVDGQTVDGYSDLVVRANSSETSMNEAVALELLGAAGLATEQSVATRFSVNGSAEVLRLTLQNLDDTWLQESFGDDGAGGSVLYKADAEGDWSWRGDDGAAYAEAFDVEAGAEDYAPLVELLDLANNGTDEEFAAQLPELLDVEQLARYLAFEDLIGNVDDISGPGNNSYLYWDAEEARFTVVAWDHNLAFGQQNVGGGGGGLGGGRPDGDAGRMAPPSGEMPTDLPTDGAMPGGGGMTGGMGGGGMSQDNPLVDRFLADDGFAALYDDAVTDLQAELVDSGLLADAVAEWSAVLTDGASDLVDPATITAEGEAITTFTTQGANAGASRVPGGGSSSTAPSTPPSEETDPTTT
ncbi:CotH kinase family protein [Serinibacter arcticus]|uniref:Cellulosomal protein n=1 Tax=Serinibacter arcticus TaxID=1655435 RepID=A0A4Z1E6U8_9MICO|nr:CotH kinase family protein [Serinibacter arcticus]TGO05311.1 cellulosomal protein [Serinibacter arcticus]